MREFKFRAWGEYLKEMRYNILNLDSFKEGHWKKMQWTGLQDKNGQDIYESDIVKTEVLWSKEILVKEVKLVDGSFSIEDESNTFLPLFNWFNVKDKIEFKVIGNIYEKPELLKEERDNKQPEKEEANG